MKNKIVLFCRLALLLLFVGYYSSITFFSHAHVVEGRVVVHSHPVFPAKKSQNPYSPHTHIPAAYFVIQQLMQANWEKAPGIMHFQEPLLVSSEYAVPYIQSSLISVNYSFALLRAPPVG